MFGEQTLAQLRTGLTQARIVSRYGFGSPFSSKSCGLWTVSVVTLPLTMNEALNGALAAAHLNAEIRLVATD